MRTYYDPEDEALNSNRIECLRELDDHLRTERKDREIEEMWAEHQQTNLSTERP